MFSLFQLFFILIVKLQVSAVNAQDNFINLVDQGKSMIADLFNFHMQSQHSKETLLYLIDLLGTGELYGKWFKTDAQFVQNTKPQEGYSTITDSIINHSFSNYSGLKFCYYGSTSKEETVLCLKMLSFESLIQSSYFDETEMTIVKQNVTVKAEDTGDLSLPQESNINLRIRFLNKMNNQPYIPLYDIDIDKQNLVIEFETQGLDYPLNFLIRAIFPKYDMSLPDILDYFIDIVLIGFTIQLLAAHWVSEALSSSFQQISLGKLIVIHTFDIYVAFQYWIGYIRNIRPIKSIPAPSIMMILAFMSSVLHAVGQRQKKINQPGFEVVTRLNYIFWLIISISFLIFSLAFKENKLILLFGSLHEVPQIIQNYIIQTKHTWNFSMFVFLSLPKFIYIGWTFVFSDVLLGSNCDTEIKIFILLVGLQFLVLFIQMRRPRIFLAYRTLYRFLIKSKTENIEEMMCSICLDSSPTRIEEEKQLQTHDPQDSFKIITPCKHQFHIQCLKSWIEKNPSCPYCRVSLPPIF